MSTNALLSWVPLSDSLPIPPRKSQHSGEREEKDGTVQNPEDKKPKVELERLGVCVHVCVHAPLCVYVCPTLYNDWKDKYH